MAFATAIDEGLRQMPDLGDMIMRGNLATIRGEEGDKVIGMGAEMIEECLRFHGRWMVEEEGQQSQEEPGRQVPMSSMQRRKVGRHSQARR